MTPKKPIGKAFDSNGDTVQIGVDPNTVKISRPLLSAKMESIKREVQLTGGINRPIQVWRSGLIYDGITGNNFIRDEIFDGDQNKYNLYSGITEGVAIAGSIVCGGWLSANQHRIQAYKNIENYTQSKTVAGHTDRVYNNSILLQKQIIKYGKTTKDLKSATGYIFTAAGSFKDSELFWRLVLSNAERVIWHFGFGF